MTRKKNRGKKQFFAETTENAEKASAEVKKESSKVTSEMIEREYVDILNYQRKQRDNLLGNFATGDYSIPGEIKNELLKIPKRFGEIEGNIARVSTILGRFVLNFKIVFTIDPDVCNAKLFFVEIEHDLDEDIKHETLLDEVEQAHSFEFRKFVFTKWNVFYDDDVLMKDDLLQNYLHMQQEENLFFGELEMILSQLFVVRMLAYLEKMGEVGEKIRFDFKLAMEELVAKNPKFAQDFALQKRILDKFISKHDALVLIAKDEEGAKILQGYSTPLKNVREKKYPSTVIEPARKNEEKKTETKTARPTIKKKTGRPAKQSGGVKIDLSKVSKLNLGSSGGFPGLAPKPRPQQNAQENSQVPNSERLERTSATDAQERTSSPWSKRVGVATSEADNIDKDNFNQSHALSSNKHEFSKGSDNLNTPINGKEKIGDQSMPNGELEKTTSEGESEKISEQEKGGSLELNF